MNTSKSRYPQTDTILERKRLSRTKSVLTWYNAQTGEKVFWMTVEITGFFA